MNFYRADIRNALLCALAVMIACLAVWPVAEMPFDDDWSYSFTVKRLLEGGHLVYNGWSSPSIISQAYWALLWVKLFGFSFTVLRLSTIPLAGGSVGITYLLARRAGLVVSSSVFAALMLGFSPLFLPLATSFMTDVPGCFCLLMSLYALVRAGQTGWFRWMLFGVLIGAIGGSSRQIVWIAPLALLPYALWLRRQDRMFVVTAVAMWIITLLMAAELQHWFESQPYAIPEPSIQSEWFRAKRAPAAMITQFGSLLITLVFITLPAGIAVFQRMRHSRPLLGISGLVLLGMARWMLAQRRFSVGPWMISILSTRGVLADAMIGGERPQMLHWPIMPILSLVVFTVIAVLIALAICSLIDPKETWKRGRDFFLHPTNDHITTSAMILICVSYLSLLLTRCTMEFTLFDRHLIMLIPCAGIPLLRMGRKISFVQWVLFGLFGLYAVGSTQENLSVERARATAVRILRQAGIPRTQINGGFDYDAWTQLETTGYINDPRIKVPVDAHHPGESRFPDLRPVYRLEYGPLKDSMPTKFGTVSYFSLWPPFNRRVWIDRIDSNQDRVGAFDARCFCQLPKQ